VAVPENGNTHSIDLTKFRLLFYLGFSLGFYYGKN